MAKSFMTEEQIFNDAQLIKSMSAPIPIKIRMLSELFSGYENVWEVVGITKNAIKRFKDNGFTKKSGMRINRAHLQDRCVTYEYLLSNDLKIKEWWDYFKKHNLTILATSEENKHIKNVHKDEILMIPSGLFKSQGYAWRHGKLEIDFLLKNYK